MTAIIIVRPESATLARVECRDCGGNILVSVTGRPSLVQRLAESLSRVHVCALVSA